MEWLKELLKKLGIAEDEIGKIDAEVRKELPLHFVPKSQYNDLSEAKKKLEADLRERDEQLETLKKSAGDNEELKKQIQTLQDENKVAKEQYEADMKKLRVVTASKLAIANVVHDVDVALSLIDTSKIELDENGNVKAGLEDQVKALRESKAFLFVEKEDGTKFKGTKPPEGKDKAGGGQKNPWSREHFNLTEQGKILRDNPDLAKQLQAAAN